jgi:thiamine-phosphate diphosphorylase
VSAVEALRNAAGGRALILVNGDPRAAEEGGADGMHLPEGYIHDIHGLRANPYAEMIISRSVHSVHAAMQAERAGADMLVLGTVFASKSHPGGPTIGVEGVRAVCDGVQIPVIAIGGITARNAADVMHAGASGTAVISAIFDAPDPRAAAAELRAAIDGAWRERN